MAGCNSNKETYLTSYQDETETVKIQHVDWTPPQIRREVARILKPRFRQDKASVTNELSGKPEYEGTDFTFFPGIGVSFSYGEGSMGLLELHERQKRLTLQAYSESQHTTSFLIEQAFQQGATQVVTSYEESSGQRDIVVMTLDRVTGKGKMRVINTLNDHTMSEMQNLVKKNFAHLSEVHPTTNAFILCDARISEEQIRQKPTMHGPITQVVLREEEVAVKDTFRSDKPVFQEHPARTVLHETAGAAKTIVHEMRYTADAVKQFIQRSRDRKSKKDRAVINEPFVRRVRRMFEHSEKKRKDSSMPEFHQEQKRGAEWVKLTQKIIREKTATSVTTLLFIRATGVGIGGIFESLNTISRLLKASSESVKQTKKEKLNKPRYKEIFVSQKYTVEKMRAVGMSESFNKLTKKEQRLLCRKEKLFRRKEKKLLRRKDNIKARKIENQLWKSMKRLLRNIEKQVVTKKIKQKEKFQKINVVKKEIRTGTTRKEHQTKKQENQHSVDFSIASVIWFLLHMQTSLRPMEKPREVRRNKHKKLKEIIVKEPAPWLIFAIIYLLAMIRESGKAGSGYTGQGNKKSIVQKQKIVQPLFLPPTGVIFAFAS